MDPSDQELLGLLAADGGRALIGPSDLPRLVDLVVDPARHDRMLALTGGDIAALAEITACQDLVLAAAEPDLEAMLRLCSRRTCLTTRNRYIPLRLPAVWTVLGEPARAEVLVRSISPYRRKHALAGVAEAVTGSITRPDRRDRVPTGDLDQARQLADRAETVARAVPVPEHQSSLLRGVALAFTFAGDHDRAETVVRSIVPTSRTAEVLILMAEAVAAAGDTGRARQLAEQAGAAARSASSPDEQARALTTLARAVAAAGDTGRARQFADRAEIVARPIADRYGPPPSPAAVDEVVAAIGDPGRAEIMARAITHPGEREEALTVVARAFAAAGDRGRAGRLLAEVLAVASSWEVPLPVLAEYWPQVVLRCVDELSDDWRLRDHSQR
ncbi:tetratricopeptide repeat protein [Actinoplanes sp. NPDC020271]|uniref:tetratricopeptide repeat protein n=1 Tax=Actinoplanes sp. NPDC020271 TaxID=3363896 RepID=UPI00379B0FAD